MEPIYYILGIDARPWKKTSDVGLTIPLAAFFATVAAFRYALTGRPATSDVVEYGAIVVLVALAAFLSGRIAHPWKKKYTDKFVLNLIYLGIIASVVYVALAYIPTVHHWLVNIENNVLPDNDALNTISIVMPLCAFGLLYIVLLTSFHVRTEAGKLAHRPSSHIYFRYRAKERRSLLIVYGIYFIGSIILISCLSVDLLHLGR